MQTLALRALAALCGLGILASTVSAQTTWSSFEDRASHALATEFSSGLVTMFGGASTNGSGLLLDDTIKRDNQTWQPQTPPSKPTGRKEHAMAGGLGVGDAPFVILFGGLKSTGSGTVRSNDTWRYDGSNWGEVPVPPATRPSVRSGHGMVQDLLRNKVILIGGLGGIVPLGDVWEFDPVADTWTQRLPAAPVMPGRYGHAMAWDPVTGNVLVFGGNGNRADTWEYNPVANSWTNRTPAGPNPVAGRVHASMAYHPLADQIVLFGGATATGVLDDTWLWDRNTSTWQPTTPTTRPPARRGQAMTPEQDGSVVLVHGGTDGAGSTLRGTWAWTGTDWTTNLPPPSPRKGAGMAYDSVRRRHVLFGGIPTATGTDTNETWELDQFTWRRRTTATVPPPRSDMGMAYDSSRQRMVLYGGRSGGNCGPGLGGGTGPGQGGNDDTWEWDGSNWLRRVTANAPPGQGGTPLVFDSTRNRIWLQTESVVPNDMWSYDGIDWTRRRLPEPRGYAGIAYDSLRMRTVVFSGLTGPSLGLVASTEEWDGVAWTIRQPAQSPPPRHSSGMAYDAARGVCVLFGGNNGQFTDPQDLGDTWLWDGVNWTQGAGGPMQRRHPQLAYDPIRQRVVMFGGYHAGPLGDTWEWDGSSWTYTGVGPGARAHAGFAWDSVGQRILMVGGIPCGGGSCSPYGDTWGYTASGWQLIPTPVAPTPGIGSMAEAGPGQLVYLLYHDQGQFSNGGSSWLWNGSQWSPRSAPIVARNDFLTAPGPTGVIHRLFSTNGSAETRRWNGQAWDLVDSGAPPNTNAGMAYDARRDRIVRFGGMNSCSFGATYNNQTFEWDGSKWLQLFPAVSPSARGLANLSYDEARGRVVLFGGRDANGELSDTWEWDGTTWIPRLPAVSPPVSSAHGLSHDLQRRVTVGFGANGTWDYGPTFPASIAPYGQGCQGTAGVPELKPTPWAGPWLGDRMEIDILRRPPGFGLMVYGFSDTLWNGLPLPLPIAALGIPAGNGCTLQSSVEWSEFLPFSGRYTSFPMPTLPIALGFTMHMQAGFLDAGTPGFPVVVSQGLHITFGAK